MLLDWLFSPGDPWRGAPLGRRAAPSSRHLRFEALEERIALTIVAGGDGSQNTTAPTDDPGFANIGIRGSGSAVYLGDGWVLTATHVGAGVTYLDSGGVLTAYNAVPNSAINLVNPIGAGYTQYSDLTLYQIQGRPDLPSISIGSAAPSVGWSVVMIGNGRNREPSEVYWTSTWQPSATPSTYAGYLWDTSMQDIRWGTNVISSVNMMEGVDVNSETAFGTTFNANVANEGTGSWGDSGGGVFHKDATGNWQLVGLMFAISPIPGEPIGASAFGDITYMADLSVYRSEILSAIGANHAPTGTSTTVTPVQGTAYTFSTSDFGFSDPLDTPADNFLAVKITTLPAIGNLTDNGVAVAAGQFVSVADIQANDLQYSVTSTGGAASTTFTFQVEDDGGTAAGGIDLDPSPKTMTLNLSHIDTTPPTVVSVTPLGASTGVAVNTLVTATFSEALNVASVTGSTFQLRDSNNNLVAATVTYNSSTKTATLTPTTSLANGMLYMLTIVGGSSGVEDLAGNDLATNIFSSFTTVAAPPADTTPPTVVSVSPVGASTGVAINTPVSVTFSEALNAATVSASTFQLRDPSNNLVTATISYSTATKTVTLTPTSPLANGTLYMLTIVGGSSGVKDLAGNALVTNIFSSFTTVAAAPPETTPPAVTAVTPSGASTGVSIGAAVTITFSEPLNPSSVSGSSILLRDPNNNLVAATVSYNAGNNTATLTPTSPLANGTLYMLTVVGGAGGVTDLAGNALAANVFSSFTTVAAAPPADTTPPTVVSVSPVSGSTGVATGTSVAVVFSEPLNLSSVSSNTIQLLNSSFLLVPATVSYNASNNTATLTPTSPLTNGAQYMLTVVAGANGVKDLAGNALATSFLASFTTVAASPPADTTPPTVVSVNPLGASIGVAINTPVTITFSEPLNPTSVSGSSIQLRDANNNLVSGTVSYNAANNTATLTPTNSLANATLYMLTVVGGAGGIEDLAGNDLATNIFSSFTTVAAPPADTTPPTVVAVSPGGASTGVAINTPVTITFSEPLNPTSVSGSSIQLRDANNNLVLGTVSYNAANNTATLTPTNSLANGTLYMLTVVGGAGGIEDLAGNDLATNIFSSFTTVAAPPADTTPPTVVAVSPVGASTGVAINTPVSVKFSEALNAATITASTFQLRDSNNNLVATTISYSTATKTVKLTPTSPLTNSTTYMLTVVGGASGVKDLAGNALAANVFSSFTTVAVAPADTTPPTVVSVSPAGASTGVAINTPVSVKFSEALNAATITASTFQLRDSNNNLVAATISYSTATKTATLTPTSPLTNSTTYLVTIVGGASGVKDLAGNALAANVFSSFTTIAAASAVTSLWSESITPGTVDSGDGGSIELGVKFTASTDGFVTGVEFYKAAANTGVHTGSLWSSTGQLLATGTFTNETATGWQTLVFSTPVALTAGMTYVASYHTTTGHYSVNRSSFTSPFTSGPLTVAASGGVYLYGAGGFPTQSYSASNYWVEPTFSSVAPVDNTPPTVTGVTPAGASTNVATNASITAVFSEALNVASVTGSTIQLRDANNNLVAATVSYNSATNTATLTPTSPLANATTYMITVVGGAGGVTDLAGNALAANVFSSFTTIAVTSPVASLWSSSTMPATVDSGDGAAIELGVQFTASTNGFITGVEFYKAAANAGVHTGSLWSSTGQLLATGTFINGTASGWQTLVFSTPVAITAGATYVASYHTTTGHYSVSRSYFTSPYTSGPLTALSGGGVYLYGAGGFPTQSYSASNYWVEPVFSSVAPVDTTPPTVTAVAPAGASTGVATGASITVTFSEPLTVASVSTSTIQLRDASNNLVAATVSYNAATKTVTLTPTSPLTNSTTYLVTIVGGASGVKDLAGNALAANVFSSFTTIAAASAVTSLWSESITPGTVDSGDGGSIELGVKFTASTDGFVTGVEFYKAAANTGVHTGNLWSSTGQLLATGTFTNETATGWQTLVFSTPVALTAGMTYVASYHTTTGHYSVNRSSFTSPFTSGPLTVAASGGVYLYGAGGFPTQSYSASNYWVEPTFVPLGS